VSAPVPCVPLTALDPDHAPLAVQVVALVEDQLSVELPPLVTLVGPAVSDTVGALVETVTVADCDAEPPAPVQMSVYFVVAVSGAVLIEPLIGSDPVHPPEAVQEVALVDDQLNVDVAPLTIVLGLADKVMAGAGVVTDTVADCVALPPLPVHVIP
jgi:hypothetical protein